MRQETIVAILKEGDGFGELALIQDHSERRATVTCRENCEFAVVHKRHYDSILKDETQKDVQEKVTFLRKVPVFGSMTDEMLEHMALVMTRREYLPRVVVLRQHEELEDLFFVVKGTLKMIRELDRDFHMQPWSLKPTLPGASGDVPPLHPWTVYKEDKALFRNMGMGMESTHVPGPVNLNSTGRFVGSKSPNPKGNQSNVQRKMVLQSAKEKMRRAIKAATKPRSGTDMWYRAVDGAVQDQMVKRAQKLNEEMVNAFQHAHKLEFPDRIFVEVATVGRCEYFAENCVLKNATSQTSVITTSSAIVYIINKWDLLKRVDKGIINQVLEQSMAGIDEDNLKEQYVQSLKWTAFKQQLVDQVL